MQDSYIATLQHFSQLVEQVSSKQWQRIVPTTPKWTVTQLVNHAAGNNTILCKSFGAADELKTDTPSDPAAAWRESADNAITRARAVSDLRQMVHGMHGQVPAGVLLNMMLGDQLIHSYDLARAIGADTTLDRNQVQLAYDFMAPNADKLSASGLFGPAVRVPDNASLQDKLLGISGRQPA